MSQLKHPKLSLISLFAFSSGLIFALSPLMFAQAATPTTSDHTIAKFNWFQAIILGMVQGLTEFLPISSTAHLKVVPVALGWGDPGVAFTAVIQLGSIAAVLWYFWSDLSQIIRGMIKAIRQSDYKSHDFRLGLGIALGTLPILFFGLLMKVLIPDLDNSPMRSLNVIAIASIVMALLLALSEKLGTHKRNFNQLGWRDGVVMGFAQSLALIPGVSRSGSTITSGLFINLERATAARFSFLLGIPAITLAGIVELKDVADMGLSSDIIFPVIVGVISSAVFSYLAIAWLIRYLQKRDTWIFVWYRLGFGVLILGSLLFSSK
ncbi:undecaprenyl-diphosphate phosphatase [Crocosphaera sp. XPORK-15E]|uniref:undecaprenyl-diphosphate phosphatase n=1 Tax=Crocosphaera sp. XPORK-15E TaxID=3110247 RepID=UPI002B215215|nr:undecaprenyl-diphosphate phosphatase [Crocosphaera sp. XPORK-15E]MEA5532539.1 undecaprenyl-diphosphate phosphatase [Crocosphaera sp. XPORK-15E]